MVDTNILITFFTSAPTELEELKSKRVLNLFREIEAGTVRGLLLEVVLHEFFYVLLGSRYSHIELSTLCERVGGLLSWPGWRFESGEFDIYMRALDILQADPKLEFSDSVIAARAEAHGAALASFDRRLAMAYGGPLWEDS